MQDAKVLMLTMIEYQDEPLLRWWLEHLEKERTESKVDLQGLILLRNMTEAQAVEVSDIAEPGYLSFLNVGNSEQWDAYNIGFQYAKNLNFDYIYSVRICSHPPDETLEDLLKYARQPNAGIVSGTSHFVDNNMRFCIMGHVKPGNVIGMQMAGDKTKKTIWMDYVSLHCAVIPKKIFGTFQMEEPKGKIRNMEYAFSDKVKKAGFKLLVAKDNHAFFLKVAEDGKTTECY